MPVVNIRITPPAKTGGVAMYDVGAVQCVLKGSGQYLENVVVSNGLALGFIARFLDGNLCNELGSGGFNWSLEAEGKRKEKVCQKRLLL
jgi:hypothetical protein